MKGQATLTRMGAVFLGVALLASPILAGLVVPAGAAPSGIDTALSPATTVAATTGAAGSTTAQTGGHPLRSGETHWRGWELTFDGSQVVSDPGSASEADRTFGIWHVDQDGQIGSRVTTFTIGSDGTASIPTGSLVGRFVIRYNSDPVYVEDGVGYLSSPPDGTAVTVANSAWRVKEQTLSTAWSDDIIYNGQVTRLTLTSNRSGAYTVAVSISGAGFANLTEFFPSESYAPNYDARSDENVILLTADGDETYPLNVSGLAAGTHVVEIKATDTTATTDASLAVTQPPGSPRIVAVERGEQTGDVLDVELRCNNCYLVVGGPGEGVLDVIELSDETGDGRVNLRINTRYAGLDLSRAGVPSGVTGYSAGEDTARRLPSNTPLSPPDRLQEYELGRVRTELGYEPNGRQAPIRAGTYDLTVSESQYITLDTGFVVRDETHVQSVELSPPSLAGITTAVMPGGSSEAATLSGIHENAVGSGTVAMGDFLVVRIDVSGIYGHLQVEHDNAIDGIVGDTDEGIDLTMVQTGSTSGEPVRIDFSRSQVTPFVDASANQVFLVLDTSKLKGNRAVAPGQTFRIRFTMTGGDDAYPYIPDGTTSRAAAEISLVEPDATIKTTDRSGDQVVYAGTTTVAPGSVVTVSTSALGDFSWKRANGVVVREDRTWRVTIDYADAPSDEFSVRVLYGDQTLATLDRFSLEAPATATGPGDGTATGPAGGPGTETVTGTAGSPTSPGGDGGPQGGDGTGPSGPGGTGGLPFAPGIPAITGILALVIPAVVVLSVIGALVLAVAG